MKNGINNCKRSKLSAFTLVELSISIVIIGLLIAGVMSGQRLVQQAKLQGVLKELQEYDSNIKTFKDKFKYYPGDFPTAVTYWSSATNGNGNWQIQSSAVEDLQFWYQLSQAGLISGRYTGATSGTRYAIGTNAPQSVIAGSGYQALYASSYYATKGNLIMLGSMFGNTDGLIDGAFITPNDAYLIDMKADDGLADAGIIYTARGATSSTCVSAALNTSSATYTLSDNTKSCRILYWLDKNK